VKPGDRVECILSPMSKSDIPPPLIGQRFTVIWTSEILGTPVIDLFEKPYPETSYWHRGIPAHFFRVIVQRKTDISALEALLHPTPEKVRNLVITDTLAEILFAGGV
jgi:hypothetical protein